MNSAPLHPCPCCGYLTLNQEPPGTYLICPICFWEDDGDTQNQFGSGSNQVTLQQAQRNFMEFGACELQWVSAVRPPDSNDVRVVNWKPLDEIAAELRQDLITQIRLAFQSVRLGAGITLHQARAIDDYQDAVQARQMDREVRWQDIPDTWIETLHDVFAFMNPDGIRHALPAYLIWCLKYNQVAASSFEQTVRYACTEAYRAIYFPGLDDQQRQVIDRFCEFIARFD